MKLVAGQEPGFLKETVFYGGGIDKRIENIRHSLARKLTPMPPCPFVHKGSIAIVGYGSSLKKTWRRIRNPMITTSGAHDFMIGNGIVPKMHVECDAQEHKARSLANPHKDCTYMIASVCHPALFDHLKDQTIAYWHAKEEGRVDDFLDANDPDGTRIGGGTNAGLRAIGVAHALGYRTFDLYGVDCSLSIYNGDRHAGVHYGKTQPTQHVTITTGMHKGRKFLTTPQMLEAAHYVVWLISKFQDFKINVHGYSLLKTMVDEAYAQLEQQRLNRAA